MKTSLCLVAAVACAPAALAVPMYALNNLAPGAADTLIMFDSDNPAGYTTIGSTGINGIGFGGLDFDASGNLWAYASFYEATGGAAAGLYRIDTSTGQATQQGALSNQSLQDIAYNPVNGRLYGVNTQRQFKTTTLYEIDTVTGGVTAVGEFTGTPASHTISGFGIDSAGKFYLHDAENRVIYASDSGLAVSTLYSLPDLDTFGSQGLTVDWSRDDQGYHAAVGRGEFPNYFSTINAFNIDGSEYLKGGAFGPNNPDGIPPVQPGDIAIMPVPAPGAAAVIALAAPLASRRRRG